MIKLGVCLEIMLFWFSGKVLVHCHVGVSRSATLVLAYLMLKQNLTLVEAICAVKDNRGVIPNRGFLRQLIKLDGQLFGTHWTLFNSITGQVSWVQNKWKSVTKIAQALYNRGFQTGMWASPGGSKQLWGGYIILQCFQTFLKRKMSLKWKILINI